MKFALVLAALIGVLGFTQAEASAASSPFAGCPGTIAQGGHVCIVGGVIEGSPRGWHWARDVVTGQSYLFPDSKTPGDDTVAFVAGFYRNQNGSLVVALDGSSTVSFLLPLPGGSSTAAGNNQSLGIQAYDGSANMVPLQETGGSLNAQITGSTTLAANPTQNIEYYSGVCFQLSGQAAGTCPTVSGINGCTATNVLPCFWDVGGTFGGSLVGHTLYGIWFHSGQTMTQLNVQVTCLDTATGTFAGSALILGDLTTGSSMGVDQYIPVGGAGGRKITAGLVCELFAIGANTTPLSNTAKQQVGLVIR